MGNRPNDGSGSQKFVPIIILSVSTVILLVLCLLIPQVRSIVQGVAEGVLVVVGWIVLCLRWLLGLSFFLVAAIVLGVVAKLAVQKLDESKVRGRYMPTWLEFVSSSAISVVIAVLVSWLIMLGSTWPLVEGFYWTLGSFTMEPVRHKLVFEELSFGWFVIEFLIAQVAYWVVHLNTSRSE